MRLSKPEIATDGLMGRARQDQDVLAVIVFGSRARGDDGPTSDLDVCLVLQPKDYSALKLSRKRLEYLKCFSVPGLDIHVYQQLPLYIRKRILKEGETLFCRDEDALYELAFRTVQEFEDFKRIYYGYLEEVARV
jgi:predicted nucleotidyltransferase